MSKKTLKPSTLKPKYISHKLLQDGMGFFVCTKKSCKQQIIPMLDGYIKKTVVDVVGFKHRTETIKENLTVCSGCRKEYTRNDLEKLAKDKKMMRAVKITK